METSKIDLFLMMNGKYFQTHDLPAIKSKLETLSDSQWSVLQLTTFKEPTTALILSILTGPYGIDRFYIGDTGLGIGKLLTCGGLGIWTIIDWFLIQGATKDKNRDKFHSIFIY